MSETSTAPGGRRGIGSALALLPLLVRCGLASPAPALTRRTRWAAGILVASLASLALLPPAPAKAQTTVGVSNRSISSSSSQSLAFDVRTAFTTGGTSTDRYTLSSVTIDFDFNCFDSDRALVQVEIHNSGGTQIGSDLTRSGTTTIRNASGITLNGATTYYLVFKGTLDCAVAVVTGDSETGTTGWSIANVSQRSVGGTWSNLSGGRTLRFSISATTVPTATLTTSAVTQTSAMLALANNSAAWWYKRTTPAGGTCTPRSATTRTLSLSSLTAGTSYTFKAYSASGCNAANEIASETFTTLSANLTADRVTQTTARLRFNRRGATWYYKRTAPTEGTCTSLTALQTTLSLSSLTAATFYTVRAYSNSACSTEIASATFDTLSANLVSSLGACGARLTGDGRVLGRWVPGECRSTVHAGRYARWYEFTLAERRRVSISLRSGDADPYLYLRSGARRRGIAVASNDDGGPGLNSRMVHTLDAGTYTIEATTFRRDETGVFTLTLASQAEQAPSESQCTQRLTGDGAVTGRWATGCDSAARAGRRTRWYEFTLAGRRDVVIDLHSGGADPYLYLRSGAGVRSGAAIASDDDGGRGYNSRLARPLDAGTYTVEATTYGSGETGGFTLTLSGTGQTATSPPEDNESGGQPTTSEPPPASEPELRIFDARANEGSPYNSGEMNFRVTLAPAQNGSVGVCYQTRDGTAQGDLYGRYGDYEEAYGCMYFAAGETSKYVSVRLIGDWHDEGEETFFMVLEDARGAIIADGKATGTIVNSGPIPKAWTTRFGRTVADQVLEGVETRLRSAPMPGVDVHLAGERLEWPDASDGTQPVAQQVADQLAQWLVVSNGDSGAAALRTLNGDDLLSSSSFALASPVADGGLLSFWGRGSVTSFDGREGELSLDGQVTTVMLGTDWSWGQWPDGGEGRRSTAGLLLSHSRGHGGYTGSEDAGDVDATVTGAFPWIGHRFSHQLEAWGAAGYGQGELQVTPKLKDKTKDGATLTADLNLWLAAGGLRGTLLDGGNAGLTLTGKGDAMVVGVSSGQVTGAKDNLAASQARVTRLRLGLEAQRPILLGHPDSGSEAGSGATLTPSLEVGLRHDGGDAETGFGLDLGGGIVLSHPERGLQAEVRGRGLLSHAAEGFRDRGFSGSLSWQQQPDSDRGAALSLSQTMGGLSSGGADALLSRTTLEGLTVNDSSGKDRLNNQRLELQLSYGLPVFSDRFTLTPELGLGFYDSGRDYRLGWSLTQPDGGESFAFSFDVTRRESNNNGDAPDHGVELRLDTLF